MSRTGNRTAASPRFSPSSSMNAVAHASVVVLISTFANGLVVFDNHRYGGSEASHLRMGLSGLQHQVLKERKDFLMKFIDELQPSVSSGDSDVFKPKDHIAPSDVVGVIPPDMFKARSKNSTRPRKPPVKSTAQVADSDTGESQIVQNYKNLWSYSEFTPERIRNHKYAPAQQKSYSLYEKPYGRVRVHTYRGPQKEYWVIPEHHKPEQKTYSPWGYYVKQPVGSEQHKFHSPLDLTFRFE